MLDALRGQKAKKFTAWILVILVGIPFIFYFGWSPSQGSRGGSAAVAAEINGTPIHWYEIPRLRMEMVQSLLGPQALSAPQDLINSLLPDEVVLDEAIRGELLAQAAQREGLELSDQERDAVLRSFVARRTGISPDASASEMNAAFAMLADRAYGYPPDLMQYHIENQELRDRATRILIYPQAGTSILELWQAYEERNTEYRLSCAVFRVSDRISSAEITDADIEEFYESNRDQFAEEPSRIYQFVAVRLSDQRTDVTDEEVSEEYQANLSDYTDAEAAYEISQIVMEADPDSDGIPAGVAEVEALLASGEDFGTVAREHSVDEATRNLGPGGRMGWRSLDMLQEPIANAVVALAPGEISAPVLSGGHWFILRLENSREAQVLPFEEVAGRIRETLERGEIERIFQEYEGDFLQVFDEYTRLEDMANALNLEIQTAEPVAVDANYIPGLGSIDQRRDEFRRLEVGQLLPEVFVTPDTIAIVSLEEERQETTMPLDDALRATIRMRLAQIRAEEAIETEAYTLREQVIERLAEAPDEDTLAALASEEGSTPFQVVETEPFTPMSGDIANVGVIPGLARELYYSPTGTISDVMAIRQQGGTRNAGYVVWILRDRVAPERSDFYAALPALRAQVLRENQDRLLNEWIADARQPEANEIVRHELDRL